MPQIQGLLYYILGKIGRTNGLKSELLTSKTIELYVEKVSSWLAVKRIGDLLKIDGTPDATGHNLKLSNTVKRMYNRYNRKSIRYASFTKIETFQSNICCLSRVEVVETLFL